MEEKIYKEISRIAQEASRAIGELYIAPSEMTKIDMHGMRNVGWYRIGEAAKMFHWCGFALERLAAEHGFAPRPPLAEGTQTENSESGGG